MNMKCGTKNKDLPYAVLTVRGKVINFTITDKNEVISMGSEPIAMFPVTGLKRLIKVLNMHKITDKNCEVI